MVMRYILMKFAGQPPAERPVGMNDILGIGQYQSIRNAMRYMRPAGINVNNGITHLGLYASPLGEYMVPDPLVHVEKLT